jgi:peptidyl-prolyl cis-trans isomerase SurA
MTHRLVALSLALSATFTAQAQGLRMSGNPLAAPPVVQRQADYIVAIVNSEPITNNEVRLELQRVTQQLAQQGRPPGDSRSLAREVLESLITRKAQLQLARESGVRAEPAAIDQAELAIARQNQLDRSGLRERLAQDGLSLSQFRNQLQDQILLTRLREREVDARVRISDLEVDQYLREQQEKCQRAHS